jgi:glycosyltransferase involved in cell wall biosynthesis
MVSDAARRIGLPRVCHHRWIFEGAAIDWLNKFGAERHVFVSRALMGQLCEASERLAESPCEAVHDGLPLPQEGDVESRMSNVESREAAKRELGLDPAKQLVLFAGQIIERKGVAEVLRAWAELRGSDRGARGCGFGDEAELVIVGDDLEGKGAYRAKMEALAAELACGARFAGFQKNVPVWLTAADIVLVPSHAEPLGNATLEAMAYARPVIGTRVGGIPEIVLDGKTGLLVPPRDHASLAGAIERLLVDADLRERLGAAGRRRCERLFSIEAHVRAMVRQYELAIALGGHAQRRTPWLRLVGASA